MIDWSDTQTYIDIMYNDFDHGFFLKFKGKWKKSESKTRLGHQAWGDLYCINYTAGGEKFKIFCYFVFSKLGEILEGKLL